jgi:hypothetical protein
MIEYIQNPRRTPRAPARCRTTVVSPRGTFEAETADVGPHGCQLVSPRHVRRGEPVQLEISHAAVKEPLRLAARIAWASNQAPWRLGVAFDAGAREDGCGWFEKVLASDRRLCAFRRVPDRIPVEASVFLGAPPRFVVDFTPDEAALLRAIGSGSSVAELRARLRDRWTAMQRALFSLLAHQHVTLSRGASVHPDAWKRIIAELEASLAVESLRRGSKACAAAGEPARAESQPARAGQPRAWSLGVDMGATCSATSPLRAGGRPLSAAGLRSAEAHGCYERALAELEAGRRAGGMALLRRALALAPGDPEIAGALVRVSGRGD